MRDMADGLRSRLVDAAVAEYLEAIERGAPPDMEEFLARQRAIDTHGVPGLRVTRLQIYRDNPPSRVAKPRC